jgi:hypothetical protein
MEKIETEIENADLIIGDITFSSPNVFYELGLARANKKPIIFMTQEDPKAAPVDLRQFEFIHYDLARDQDLLSKLDNAVQGTVGGDYQLLFSEATVLLQRFNSETNSMYSPVLFEEFQARVIRGEKLGGVPAPAGPAYFEFLLPKVISEATDMSALRKIEKWLINSKRLTPSRVKRQRPAPINGSPTKRR